MRLECSKCDKVKDINDFAPSAINKIGASWCRDCSTEYYRIKNNVKSPRTQDVGGLRQCGKCKEIKKLEDFTKNKKCSGGFERKCKACTNKDCWAKKNPIENKKYKDKWYEENKDRIREEWKEVYKEKRDIFIAYQYKYRSDPINLQKMKIRQSKYNKNNPEVGLAHCHRRRDNAIVNGNNTLSAQDIKQIKQLNPHCKACGVKSVTLDHIVPLDKGGQNCIENCTVLCKTCNSSKHNKTPQEWLDHLKKFNLNVPVLLESFVESLK